MTSPAELGSLGATPVVSRKRTRVTASYLPMYKNFSFSSHTQMSVSTFVEFFHAQKTPHSGRKSGQTEHNCDSRR